MYYKTLKIILHNVTIIIIIIFTLRSNFFQNPFHLAPYVNFASKLFCFLSRRPPTTIILNIILLFKNKAILSISFNFFSQNNIYRFVYDGAKCFFNSPQGCKGMQHNASSLLLAKIALKKEKNIHTNQPTHNYIKHTHILTTPIINTNMKKEKKITTTRASFLAKTKKNK